LIDWYEILKLCVWQMAGSQTKINYYSIKEAMLWRSAGPSAYLLQETVEKWQNVV